MNDPMHSINEAIKSLHTQNELMAANATIKRLEERISSLESKCADLRESGDDLWYCLRHRQEDPADAIENWKEARDV